MRTGRLNFTILASMLNCVDAAPQGEHSSNLISRAIGNILAPTTIGVYFCPEAFWNGDCQYLQNGPGICIKLDKSLAGKTSSVGPDEDASGCTLFQNENCSGLQLKVEYPGVEDLPSTPQAGEYNDFIRSYICY